MFHWNALFTSGKIKKEMTPKTTSVLKILEELNKGQSDKPWVLIPGSYMLSAVSIMGPTQINITSNGVVLSLFINSKTGEIRTYLTKWIEGIPESQYL